MRLPKDIVEFLGGPAMILLGTRSEVFVPEIGRGVGLRLSEHEDEIDLIMSRWQWPQTVSNIAANGSLAATLSRPTDYVTYQIKGTAVLRDTRPEDLAVAEAFVRRMSDCLGAQGVTAAAMSRWFCLQDTKVARLAIETVFVQTPGALAGTVLDVNEGMELNAAKGTVTGSRA
jgi:hypothetical protein